MRRFIADLVREDPESVEPEDSLASWMRPERIDWEPIWVGALATILLHVLLLLSPVPESLRPGETVAPKDSESELMFAVQPLPPDDPDDWEFVQANPDVIQNPPDDTHHFAARDQQAAQPEPSDELSPDGIPVVEGEMPESTRIVETDLAEEIPFIETGTSPVEGQPRSEAARAPSATLEAEDSLELDFAAPPPMPEFIQHEPEGGEGIGSWLEPDEHDELLEEAHEFEDIDLSLTPHVLLEGEIPREEADAMEEARDAEATEGREGGTVGEPIRPRPRVRPQVPPGPLMDRPGGVSRLGAIAIDANFSEFGDYLQRMYDAIGLKWHQLNRSSSRSYAEVRSQVIVEFIINREGEVRDLRILNTSADRLRTLFCEDAILSRAPFGEWTRDMVAILGEEQPVRMTFLYW